MVTMRGSSPAGPKPQALSYKGGNQISDLVTLKFQARTFKNRSPCGSRPGSRTTLSHDLFGLRPYAAGRVGTGIGYNAYDVVRSDAMNFGFGDVAKNRATTQLPRRRSFNRRP